MSSPTPTWSPQFQRPSLQGVVERERLFKRLAANGSAVTWIAAAPGSGKTTLAASYLQASGADGLWFQVDGAENDPAGLFGAVRQAVVGAGLIEAGRLPTLPGDGSVDIAAFSRLFFRALYATLRRPATLVLDNFQDAGDAFQTVFGVAVAHMPAHLSVIVLSLSDPPAAYARFVANGRIRPMGADELHFTRAESDRVVLSTLAADEIALADLHDRSAGWAAGLVLMIEHRRRAGAVAAPLPADESEAAVFDYFASTIFAGCTPAERRALMLTASLPRLTVELAHAVCGPVDIGPLLDELHRRHLFVDRRGHSDPTYRYHRLFKAFLCQRGLLDITDEERHIAAERAATALQASGHVEDAVMAVLAAGHWRAAHRLIVVRSHTLAGQGRWPTLAGWIAALPRELVDSDPWLAYWEGACCAWSDPPSARVLLERAFDAFSEAGDRVGPILAAGVITRACILDADWRSLDRWIDRLASLLADGTADVPPSTLCTGGSRLLYVTLARRPGDVRLGPWADRTLSLLGALSDTSEAVLAGYSLLFYFSGTGQSTRAAEVIARVTPMVGDPGLSPVSLAHWQWAHANHQLRTGAPGDALASIDQALALAAGHGLTLARVIRRHRIVHLLTLGRLNEAQVELAGLATAAHVEPYLELRAWLAWQQGRVEAAFEEAGSALRIAEHRGRTWYMLHDRMLLACICASAGQFDEAIAHLGELGATTRGMPGEVVEFQACWVQASVALGRGDRVEAHGRLRRACDIGSRQRYTSFWGWSPAFVVPLLGEALAHGIGTPYVSELIRIHRLAPPESNSTNWPWPVRIRALGRFDVEVAGEALRFEGKAQRKPLEVLKMLVVAGDRGVPVDRLVETLWPQGEAGDRKNFDVTVHRLRRLLALDAAVQVSDGQARLNAQAVRVDAWELEALLRPLIPLSCKPAPLDRLQAAAPRVLALFNGPLLATDGEALWQLMPRNRLSSLFQRFAICLGESLEAEQQWQPAVDLYQRVIELFPLAESFYRRQMACLHAQGRRAEALEVFRRCRHVLSTSLGIAPSIETEQAHRDLIAF